MSVRGVAAKISSGKSTEPALALSKVVISTCIAASSAREASRIGRVIRALALHRVAHQHELALRAGDRALDHQQTLLGIDRCHLEIERRHPLDTQMARHLLVLEGAPRVLTVTGRTMASMAD